MKPTQEQIIAWARAAGMQLDPKDSFADEMYLAVLKRAFTLAYEAGRAAENEACVKVCEDAIDSISEFHPELVIEVGENVCTNLAAAIRARREQ